ncbi:MAG TPA: glycoside hydrolase family 2 TIM barrel-domain containing protein [Tepidisphaeraceae bacterium]|nr:glycoside hydrolase family 2 TIM barrel-domain containing protein [Tepidisphaeraceae bacterium]
MAAKSKTRRARERSGGKAGAAGTGGTGTDGAGTAARASSGGERGYPRPQLVRADWTNLNGPWDFHIDPAALLTSPARVTFDQRIVVPFAPETAASGVNHTGFFNAAWYRRTFRRPELPDGQRLILHFGAVDHEATVWVNGCHACTHEGGYTPFSADITDLLSESGDQTIVLRAFDDPQDLTKPRGKQDWQLEPHSIWYYRTTGIWQTVWMEVVPATRIGSLRWTPDMSNWELDLQAVITGPPAPARAAPAPAPVAPGGHLRLRVRLHVGDRVLADDEYSVTSGEVLRKIALIDPGIDDYRNDLLWSPWRPTLIDAELELRDAGGNVLDRVTSYTAMRSVAAEGSTFVLNGRPLLLQLVLDQGYWPESGLTAPDDAALRRDVELVKQLGFNGVRKHQKIEDPRFLYWADRLGLLVWEEMPSPYRFSPRTVERLTREWTDAVRRDAGHPCVICWVPFNESWGLPDLPNVEAQRNFLRGVYHLTKSLDPTRPVIGNDGWEMFTSATDIVAIHDYERVPDNLRRRYARTADNLDHLFAHERPGHRQLLLDGSLQKHLPIMLTEFGGIAFSRDTQHTWGYKRAASQKEFQQQYTDLLAAVRSMPVFAGFCYTQFTDTYQEANGLLYMDRTPKFPIGDIAKATSG